MENVGQIGLRCTCIAVAGMARCRRCPVQRGFTIIETLVVVAIIAILAALAAPSFQGMLENNRAQAAASALQASLNLARSEAVRRGSNASVTVAANGTAGQWENGWTVFLDKTGNANSGVGLAADSGGSVRLEVVPALAAATTQSGKTGGTGVDDYFLYNGNGRLATFAGASANRTFWFFDGSSNKYCLVISLTGRVRAQTVPSAGTCDTD